MDRDAHANRSPSVHRHLRRQWRKQRANRSSTRAHIIPVKAQREHPQALISRRTTEDAREPGRVLVREAENADASEGRRDVLGEPLPDENRDQGTPEEADALLLEEEFLTSVQDVEELDGGDDVRVDGEGWPDEEHAHHAREAITDELKRLSARCKKQSEGADALANQSV